MKSLKRLLGVALAGMMAIGLASCGGGGDDDPGIAPTVQLLSSQPEYVTGGTALIDVGVPNTVTNDRPLRITLNGTDVTAQFRPSPTDASHRQAVLTGMTNGANAVVASVGKASNTLAMTNYPITGPVISGPWQTPFICQTSAFQLPDGSTLGAPLDENCSVATRVNYLYMSTQGGALKVMGDTSVRPADVATVTTLNGTQVPFIVRVETGTVDRGIYQNAVIHDPTSESAPTPTSPPRAWNRRLIAIEGFGCPGGWYIQGAAQGNLQSAGFDFSLLNTQRLAEGYAMFANTLQHASNNCNAVLASEAAMMSKEATIERFGVPAFTVSAGCSGGSYGSAQPADRIPGLFDGVLISCTFPDPLSIAFSGSDGHLITHYITLFPLALSDTQIAAVTGYKSRKAFEDAANQAQRTDPVPGRVDYAGYNPAVFNAAVPASLRYDPVNNPTGIRPTVYDAAKNIYGVDKATGFALRPFDNVGVQYGLAALNSGAITTTQFLDLNEKVGGYDQDANYVANRVAGDPGAILRAYQSGLQLGTNGGLATIPVFDVTGIYNEDTAYHYQWFHFALRERMVQANGDSNNHVMWRGNPVPADTAWNAFITWVAAYKADATSTAQKDKVVTYKPANAVDGCWSDASTFVQETQTLSPIANTTCNGLFPSWTAPRIVAGGPVAANVLKCALKPIAATDYAVMFTGAEMTRMQAIFPNGVCDWSRPGINQSGVVPNGSFGPSPVNLVFDVTKS
ncbi:DUF6351 family protein [Cupriavidus agavae]|uniref:DUF6351 domain-containing protein n=1 Tax=Cupriavidus agavae TaxID=1001822 RepID=A0A4Q7R8U3_9BURK|nr:DUF6351 family protein [Cupriavidus agavae]RZT29256.1 hypothetical protein EV147_4886 [Cupriavidus agavae]